MKIGQNAKRNDRYRNQNIRQDDRLELLCKIFREIEAMLLNMLEKKSGDEKKHDRSYAFLRIKNCGQHIMRNRVRVPIQRVAPGMHANNKKNRNAPEVMNVRKEF